MKQVFRISPATGLGKKVVEHVDLPGKLWTRLLKASGGIERDVFTRTDAKAFAKAARAALGEPTHKQLAGPRGPIPTYCSRPDLKQTKSLTAEEICEMEAALAVFEMDRGVRVDRIREL